MVKRESAEKSLYDAKEDEYSDSGGGSSLYSQDDPLAEKAAGQKERRLNFAWWEWSIFIVEALLLVYTLLAFLSVVPLF